MNTSTSPLIGPFSVTVSEYEAIRAGSPGRAAVFSEADSKLVGNHFGTERGKIELTTASPGGASTHELSLSPFAVLRASTHDGDQVELQGYPAGMLGGVLARLAGISALLSPSAAATPLDVPTELLERCITPDPGQRRRACDDLHRELHRMDASIPEPPAPRDTGDLAFPVLIHLVREGRDDAMESLTLSDRILLRTGQGHFAPISSREHLRALLHAALPQKLISDSLPSRRL